MRVVSLLLAVSGELSRRGQNTHTAALLVHTVCADLLPLHQLQDRGAPVPPWDRVLKWQDVGQGNSDSCSLTAAIKIVAAKDPRYLNGILKYNKAASSLTVSLPADPLNPTTYPAVQVRVPYASVARRKQLPFSGRGTPWWPAALMRALELKRGVNCNKPVHINRALELVRGQPIQRIKAPAGGFSAQSLHKFFELAMTNGRPALLSTSQDESLFVNEPEGETPTSMDSDVEPPEQFLTDDHAYGILHYDAEEQIVTLLNPWKASETLPDTDNIPVAELVGKVVYLAQLGVSRVRR